MTEKVYPSSNPNTTTTITKNPKGPFGSQSFQIPLNPSNQTGPKLPLPPMKSQIYNQNRHPYRQNPISYNRKRRHGFRRCFCLFCFWSILIVILLLLLATISGCVLYLLYHPHRPTFTVASLKISQFNLTTATDGTTHLTSHLNLTISTKNPNKKIVFYYDPIAIACLSKGTQIANGSIGNSFTSDPNNITILRSSLSSNSLLLETETVNQMRSDLKKKSGLPLKILLDTEATMKIESFKSKRIGIRIKCEGIHSLIPKSGGGKADSSSSSSVAASVSNAKCKVDLRIKIWKWSF